MLSGEGNAGEWWKITIGLISKKLVTLLVRVANLFCTFLCRCFVARLQRETSWNFLVTHVLLHFFFTAAHFHLALVAASICYFDTTATKFAWCSSNKKMSPLFFSSRSRSLSPFVSLSFAGLRSTFSSLSFSCSIFQICGHDNSCKLNSLDNTAFRFHL